MKNGYGSLKAIFSKAPLLVFMCCVLLVGCGYQLTLREGRQGGVPAKVAHENSVTAIAFSNDGRFIASASKDSSIKIWARNHILLNTLCDKRQGNTTNTTSHGSQEASIGCNEEVGQVTSIAFSPDNEFVVAGYSTGMVYIWKRDNHEEFEIIFDRVQQPVTAVAYFSGINSNFVVVGRGTTVLMRDVQNNGRTRVFFHTNPVLSVAVAVVNNDVKYIVSGSADHTISVWNATNGQLVKRLYKHGAPVTAIAVSQVGNRMLSGDDDGSLILWDMSNYGDQSLEGYPGPVYSVALSEDGTLGLSGGRNRMELWDFREQSSRPSFQTNSNVYAVTFIDEEKYLYGTQNGAMYSVTRPSRNRKSEELAFVDPDVAIEEREDSISKRLEEADAASEDRDKWLFVVGISDYKYASLINHSAASASRFTQVAQKRLGIPEENTVELLGAEALEASIMTKLRNFIVDATEQQDKEGRPAKLYFYFSMHGVPVKEKTYPYLLAYDASPAPEDLAQASMLNIGSLYKRLEDLPVGQVMVFIDSCFSGHPDGKSVYTDGAGVALVVDRPEVAADGKLTVMTAGSNNQVSRGHPGEPHRLMSFYLMDEMIKGEYTDLNDFHRRVSRKVRRESLSSNTLSRQDPELVGNRDNRL